MLLLQFVRHRLRGQQCGTRVENQRIMSEQRMHKNVDKSSCALSRLTNYTLIEFAKFRSLRYNDFNVCIYSKISFTPKTFLCLFEPLVVFLDPFLFFRGKVCRNIECLANIFHGLVLHHGCHRSTRQVQQGLHVHIVGCQDDLKQ